MKPYRRRSGDEFFFELALEAIPQSRDHVLVDLADARFGEVEHDADLRHREVFVIVEDKDKSFFPAQTPGDELGEHRSGHLR